MEGEGEGTPKERVEEVRGKEAWREGETRGVNGEGWRGANGGCVHKGVCPASVGAEGGA